jgi:AraC family transcriptional regulator
MAQEQVRVVDLPERRLAAVRHVGPFAGIGAAFDRLGAWARSHADAVVGAPMAIYYDDPQVVPAAQLRTDVAVPVTEGVTIGGAPGIGVPGVGEVRAAAGRYAVQAHVGPYSGLATAWPRFMAAVVAAGLTPDPGGPCFEVYQSEPGTVPEAELVTLLHAPLA